MHLLTIQIITSDFESEDLFDKLKYDLTLPAALTFASLPRLDDVATLECRPSV